MKSEPIYSFNSSIYSPISSCKIPDFLEIQRSSFRHFLKKGLITEFNKYNPITNSDKTIEIFFYADHYKLKKPKWTPKQAILKRKSYACQLYIPVQIYFHKTEQTFFQWMVIANLPLMTKHGHFILNGSPRVLMNQMIRSPGVYFKKKVNVDKGKTCCADFIAERGAWLRIEVDTKKGDIWVKLKKTPKIPLFIFLKALGLTIPILNSFIDIIKLRYILQLRKEAEGKTNLNLQPFLNDSLDFAKLKFLLKRLRLILDEKVEKKRRTQIKKNKKLKKKGFPQKELPPRISRIGSEKGFLTLSDSGLLGLTKSLYPKKTYLEFPIKQAQKFLFRKFLNNRTYSLSILGRSRINRKLGIAIPVSHTTLTAQDVLFACLFLLDLLQGSRTADDIDDLKNRKIKASGELIQAQLSIGLLSFDKMIGEKLKQPQGTSPLASHFKLDNLITVKPINQAFREFFGTNPLSQLMDQTNPLAEITHKRRLSSLGPGGINRETAGMAIRGIHPSHYGRICPIETPEGQNAGLVNSITTYANLNTKGFLETPFYKTYKGFILKTQDPLLFSSDQEQAWVLAPGDIKISKFHFLPPNIALPSRYLKEFKRISRNNIHFIALSPVQMISVATSLIPFLEHDDGNRALMGSNMQRQAVPTIKLSKPIVGTGLESRVISDVGHSLQAKKSGFISYVDGNKMIIYSNRHMFQELQPPTLTFVKAKQKKTEKQNLISELSMLIMQPTFEPASAAQEKPEMQFESFEPGLGAVTQLVFQQTSCWANKLFDEPTLARSPSGKVIDSRKNKKGQEKKGYIQNQLFFIYKSFYLNDFDGQLELTNSFLKLKKRRFFEDVTHNFGQLNNLKALKKKKTRQKALWQRKQSNPSLQLQVAAYAAGDKLNGGDWLLSKNPFLPRFSFSLLLLNKYSKNTLLLFYCKFMLSQFVKKQLNQPFVNISYKPKAAAGFPAGNLFPQQEKQELVGKRSVKTFSIPKFKTLLLRYCCATKAPSQPLLSAKATIKNRAKNWVDLASPAESTTDLQNKSRFKKKVLKKPLNTVSFHSLNPLEYPLNSYYRSNQDTYMIHRPIVHEGQWVEKGDILADSSASKQGELALGHNLLVGYSPWEGYNFEDAVLINERLIFDDLYTSLHIERYEVEVRDTRFGLEQITNQIPNSHLSYDYLDENGIAKLGTWVKENDILVGKIAPIGQRKLSPYENLLYDIIGKEKKKTKDTSLRVPKGVSGRVIHIEILETNEIASSFVTRTLKKSGKKKLSRYFLYKNFTKGDYYSPLNSFYPFLFSSSILSYKQRDFKKAKKKILTFAYGENNNKNKKRPTLAAQPRVKVNTKVTSFNQSLSWGLCFDDSQRSSLNCNPATTTRELSKVEEAKKGFFEFGFFTKAWKGQGISQSKRRSVPKMKKKPNLLSENLLSSPLKIHIYLAEKRKLQLGDKIAGRHGNKGIISNILARQDMPYLPDGTPLDIVLNPLGVPSRMNVGQIFECLLGLAGYYLKQNYKIQPFDEIYGCEASRSLVYSKLYEARTKTNQNWLFNPNFPGKVRLFDGRTGEILEQPVTVGFAYILKLIHLVDDKIHARSTGPYSLVTQQPLRGRSKQGGQRVGEMEVWALEGFGAAYILQEILTIKSDDLEGRNQIINAILTNKPMRFGIPESFKVLVRELQSLCLDIVIFKVGTRKSTKLNIGKL